SSDVCSSDLGKQDPKGRRLTPSRATPARNPPPAGASHGSPRGPPRNGPAARREAVRRRRRRRARRPRSGRAPKRVPGGRTCPPGSGAAGRSEEHTSELQSRENLVCRLLLEKKNTN